MPRPDAQGGAGAAGAADIRTVLRGAHLVRPRAGGAGRAREEIDAINVYPVADGDTGTNLYLTVESATAAVEAVFAGYENCDGGRRSHRSAASGAVSTEVWAGLPTLADAVRAMAHGALIGARGNSGTILAQLLRGMAQVLAADGEARGETDGATDGESAHTDGQALRLALRQAADSAREAVAHPVEGTVLTVATAAAEAATGTEGDCGTVACAAYEGARAALMATPGQLAVLARAPEWSTRVGGGCWRCWRHWRRRSRGSPRAPDGWRARSTRREWHGRREWGGPCGWRGPCGCERRAGAWTADRGRRPGLRGDLPAGGGGRGHGAVAVA